VTSASLKHETFYSTDSTGMALIATKIFLLNHENHTASDVNGEYSLTISTTYKKFKEDTIVFSFIGFKEVQMPLSNFELIPTINLNPLLAEPAVLKDEPKILFTPRKRTNTIRGVEGVKLTNRIKKDSIPIHPRHKTQITGTVRDSSFTRLPMAHVLLVANTSYQTLADTDGNYTLTIYKPYNQLIKDSVKFSFVGFKPLTVSLDSVTLKNTLNIDVEMKEEEYEFCICHYHIKKPTIFRRTWWGMQNLFRKKN